MRLPEAVPNLPLLKVELDPNSCFSNPRRPAVTHFETTQQCPVKSHEPVVIRGRGDMVFDLSRGVLWPNKASTLRVPLMGETEHDVGMSWQHFKNKHIWMSLPDNASGLRGICIPYTPKQMNNRDKQNTRSTIPPQWITHRSHMRTPTDK